MKHFLSILCLIIICTGLFLLPAQPVQAAGTHLTWLNAPPSDTSAFRKATAPQAWQFPLDFGPHKDYQTEWWYYTGNLETAEGRPFGFQLTFFRQSLIPTPLPSSSHSHWRGNQIYSAHFTISDITAQHFYPFERFSRGSIGLAGAEADPYHVWLEDWSATEVEPGKVRLYAQAPEVGLDLLVTPSLPPILQGDRGLIIKGLEPGNASYYYSLVQQPTTGSLTVNGKTFAATGVAWQDHEYSTSSLGTGTIGWDWFSLQFDNGAALMLYLLRHEDGTPEITSSGTFVLPNGEVLPLHQQDWQLQVLDTWKSPQSGATYPAKWLIKIPKLNLTLQGQPLIPNQELNTATATYWEGAVAFQGTWQDQPLNSKGYVELTGYANRLDSLLSARTP